MRMKRDKFLSYGCVYSVPRNWALDWEIVCTMGTILNAETEEKDRLGRPKTIEVKVVKKIRQLIL